MEQGKKQRRWLYFGLALPLILIIGFYLWAETPPQPMPEALRAVESIPSVTVTRTAEGWWEFSPTASQPVKGFILYPGGRVDERSYAPYARDIAVNGYLVIVPDMPLNLAIFGVNKASEVFESYPEIDLWAIGGHSLGGAMAASFAADNPDAVDGLILWAATPAQSVSLRDATFPISVIYGSRDGLLTSDEITASQSQYPTGTQLIRIDGGNHAQFGWYGAQNGDLTAEITRQAQGDEIIAATVQALLSMSTE